MLILNLTPGQTINLVDKDAGREIGAIRRLRPLKSGEKSKTLLGFDLDPSIQILRSKLIGGSKEAPDARQNSR